MSALFSLKPEDGNSLHPEALKWFNARRVEILSQLPLEELSNDDLNIFLSDDEKCEFIKHKDEITRGLATCIKMDEASQNPVSNAIIGLMVVAFKVDSMWPMRRIGLLLKDVHQRKIAKAKQDQRERDEEDKRRREQDQAELRRKEEERQKIAAELEAREYNQHLNKEKARLKALLWRNRKTTGATSRSKLRTAATRARALPSSYLVKKSGFLIKQLSISVQRS